jgi:hypothetical protein
MTLRLKQELTVTVELEYEVIDARGACAVLAAWVGSPFSKQIDVWPALAREDQAALQECCEEDLIAREEGAAEAAYEARLLQDEEP